MNNNIEKQLLDEKERLNSLKTPEELEMRLRTALNSSPGKTKRKTAIWKLAAVAVFFIAIVASYNYNAFAYYGKKLFGFDDVLTGTLQELNEQGMGQIIGKKTTLKDGTELTIEGIMTDANQLIMYYTLLNPNGIEESMSINPANITGFLTNSYAVSGTSLMNDNQTEMKGTMFFEPVSPFAKKLTLHFGEYIQNNHMKEYSVSFAYNPNKAMQTEIKQSIRKTLQVDKGKVTFHTISATPTSTVITGLMNVENYDRVQNPLGGIQLIANGAEIPLMGGGSRSSIKGTKFDIQYDALPKKLESLQLVMNEFVGYQKVKEKIALASIKDEPVLIGDKELWIKAVAITSQGTEITIATDDDIMLDGVLIEAKKNSIPLRTTINQTETKLQNGRILKERTLLFDSKDNPEYLVVKGLHYMKTYNKTINIPVN